MYNKISVSATGNTLLTNINHANRVNQTYQACIMFYGTFGGTTMTLAISPDGGTTFIPIKDKLGNAISLTSAGYANVEICGYSNNNTKPLQLYAVSTGGSGIGVSVASFDNMG